MTHYLSTENLVDIAAELGDYQVRDMGLLDGAARRPAASVFGNDAYADVHLKAAALMESIVRHKPMIDGNRPLGWSCAVIFLGLNGQTLKAPFDPAYDLVVRVGEGLASPKEVAAALREWCAPSGDAEPHTKGKHH